jgi:hypothetical protein
MDTMTAFGIDTFEMTLPSTALNEWLAANDLDPRRIPADSYIQVDPDTKTLSVEEFLFDGKAKIVREQDGEPLRRTVTVPLRKHPKHFGLV